MMRVTLHRLQRDERGAALAVVLLVGTIMILLSSIMVARGMRQFVNTNNDTNWDRALFAAEAGLDDGLQVLDQDFDWDTGESVPSETLGTPAELDWAIAAGDARPEDDLVAVPGAEYVVVRPEGSTVLFAVGYSPSRDATERRVRVVRASVDGVPWVFTIEHAVLVGGDLLVSGNTTVNDLNDNWGAAIHANGSFESSGTSYVVEGCSSSSVTPFAATGPCPPSPAPLEPVPMVEPILLYPLATHALCSDRVVYGGPAHPTDPDPDDIPCNGGETVVVLAGWSSKLAGGLVQWNTSNDAVTTGVFYIDNGNFNGKLGTTGATLDATVIVAGSGSACLGAATGNIEVGANSDIAVHPSLSALGYDLVLIAQGDVAFGGAATVGGAILAHEQIDYRGTAESWGAVVAAGVCDTIGSPISKTTTSTLTGNSTVNYPGPIQTPFYASTLQAEVVGWYEL